MRLPNAEHAGVPDHKVRNYLLSLMQERGRTKAAFFREFGFTVDSWQVLAVALVEHARIYDVARVDESRFGLRYIIEGALMAPDGRAPVVRSVWFVAMGEETARFVTAYPLRRKHR